MKEVPFLFSTPMVQSTIEGRKTQTRREIKNLIIDEDSGYVFYKKHQMDIHHWKDEILQYAKCLPEDLIWVRETFFDVKKFPCYEPDQGEGDLLYKADIPAHKHTSFAWTPSIHMPKLATRIWLKCTGVRVERVQEITPSDANAEGIAPGKHPALFMDYLFKKSDGVATATKSFKSLWQSINGRESWISNPYVFVYEFRSLTPQEEEGRQLRLKIRTDAEKMIWAGSPSSGEVIPVGDGIFPMIVPPSHMGTWKEAFDGMLDQFPGQSDSAKDNSQEAQ